MLRRRERITWEESAKGHLAKLRHEAIAKCLAGVGELYELSMVMPHSTEEEDAALVAKASDAIRSIAAHEFMLPPDLRREVEKLLQIIRPGMAHWDDEAQKLCSAVDRYLPPIHSRSPNG